VISAKVEEKQLAVLAPVMRVALPAQGWAEIQLVLRAREA
jgi:hypothetical protein